MKGILASNKKLYVFFLALCLLFYGNSLRNGFSFDDSYVTVANTPVKGKKFMPNNQLVGGGIKNIPKIWQSRFGHGEGTAYDYRPMTTTLFAIEYSLFGPSPHLNHFVSIALFSLIAFLLFLILKTCLKGQPYKELFALVCSVIFLAHPIHTEVVNNIKCTDELLAMMFGLLATYNAIQFFELRKIKYILLGILFLWAGLYSKMTAALFLAVIPMTLYFFFNLNKKYFLYLLPVLWFCFFIYNHSKEWFVDEPEVRPYFHFENPLCGETVSFFTKILFSLKTLGMYIKLLFFPYPLRFYYGNAMISTSLSIADLDIILAVLFVIASVWFCIRTKNKIAIYGLAFFFICIVPILNFTSPVIGILGERLCLIASTGFIIFITAVLFSFLKSVPANINLDIFGKKPLMYVSFVLVVFLFCDWYRNTAWMDEITLFERDAPHLKKSAGANNLLANKYFEMLYNGNSKYTRQELIEKCKYHYPLAFNTDSTVFSAYNNLGVVYYSFVGDVKTALSYFLLATKMHNGYSQALENAGNCYYYLGDTHNAIISYRKAIFYSTKQQKSFVQLVRMLLNQKRFNEAGKLLDITDKLYKDDYTLTIERGNYYFLTGQYELAIPKLEQAYYTKRTKNTAIALSLCYDKLQNSEKVNFFKQEAASLPQ
ncbi:MAG: hypothetical protein ACXVPN_10895 [Bacteroidia bacterium]